MRPKLLDRFSAAGGLGHECHVRFVGDQTGKPFTQERMVVDRENADSGGIGTHDNGAAPRLQCLMLSQPRFRRMGH
jgi:hypothetical protein